MKVVIAIDSFKGSLDSRGAGEAARAGVLAADPAAQVVVPPGHSPSPGKASTPTRPAPCSQLRVSTDAQDSSLSRCCWVCVPEKQPA